MNPIARMLDMQKKLQIEGIGTDPTELEGEERTVFIRNMVLALLDEVHEVLGEVGWKPWAKSRHVNEERAKEELVDAWHFFMNLMLAVGLTADELYEGYIEKNRVNLERWQSGYTGVSE